MQGLAAVVTYTLLTVLWGTILVLYARHWRTARASDPLIATLFAVLSLDAAKTVVESLYFGLYWGADYHVLPRFLMALAHPAWLTAVKWLNVGVAVIVLVWLIRRWVPAELRERQRAREEEAALRERLSASLREAEASAERFEIAAQASENALWDWDLIADVVWYSPRISELLGVDPSEWPSGIQPWRAAVHPDDLEEVSAQLERLAREGGVLHQLRYRMRHRDGRTVWIEASATAQTDATGRPVRIVGFIRDVSRDRLEETTRAQAQKMESLGLLAGGIAHDFNNLLTIISTSLHLARVEKGDASADAITTASSAVMRASALTKQLLSYAGRSRREPQPVDVEALVREIAQLLAVSLSKKVELRIQAAPGLPPVLADAVQLQQVIMNLVLNAAEAIGDREGHVTIAVSQTELDEPAALAAGVIGRAPTGRSVVVEVEDDGPGMTREVMARIFDPFFTTKPDGHGLGLSTMIGILRAHDGAVSLRSAPGEGTTFSVYLPAR